MNRTPILAYLLASTLLLAVVPACDSGGSSQDSNNEFSLDVSPTSFAPPQALGRRRWGSQLRRKTPS